MSFNYFKLIFKICPEVKIFLPFKKELNPFLEEIIDNSLHTYTYESYKNYDPSYDIVNVHWPEALFEWKEPSTEELVELENLIRDWKKKSLLIYTKHDFQRNKGTTPNFTRLFQVIEINADVFIHLGEFSRNFYATKYPGARHEIIHHPLYLKNFEVFEKEAARGKLNISKEDLVIIAPGNIRSYAERDLLINAFKSIKCESKVLISTNVHSEIRYDFPGRIKMKRIIDVKNKLVKRFRNKYRPPRYIFTYSTIPKEELELKMSAADLVFIPRIDILNSGNVFLGLTFNKIVVGPAVGNIEEQLKELDLPVFDPKKRKSVIVALNKGISLSNQHNGYIAGKLEKYLPNSITKKTDALLSDLQ